MRWHPAEAATTSTECFAALRFASRCADGHLLSKNPDQKEIPVSTPSTRQMPFEVRERVACMCSHGGACSSFAPGHALHLIQARIASATPSEWVDAIVTARDAATGDVRLLALDGTAYEAWNAGGAALEVAPGTPVALHTRYGVLAVGRAHYNVALTS